MSMMSFLQRFNLIPRVVGFAAVVGFTSVTIPVPPDLLADDIILIFLETTNGTTVATPSGYTLLGPATDSATTQLHVFWKRATGSETSFTQTNTDHQAATVLGIRNCVRTGNPYEALATGSIASSASPSIPSITTLGECRRVLQSIARGNDVLGDQFSALVNTGMLLPTIVDESGNNQGNGGGVAVVAGGRIEKGASGTSGLTHAGGAITYAYQALAMKPLAWA